MSKKQLELVNERLIEHLKEVGIKDACYYEPATPDEYWKKGNMKIAFCNLEPYCTNDGDDKIKGIKPLDEERFYEHWIHNKTVWTTAMINYIIKTCMQKKEKLTEANVKFSKNELKQDSGFNKVSDGFMDAMYFNFRFTQSGTVNASHPYIIGTYTRDSFYCKHYRDFVKAAEIDVLVISGSPSVRIIELIYPELKGKFKYCGEPVCYEGTMFVSMPHPSRISDKAIADVVNKIAGAYKK